MRKIRIIVTLALLFQSYLVLASQDSVGVLLAGSRHSFWRAMKTGIEQASAEYHLSPSINSSLDDDTVEQNIAAQTAAMSVFKKRGSVGIIWAPIQTSAQGFVADDKTPVVFVDRTFADKSKVSFVATDGKKAAYDSIAKFVGTQPIKKVAIMGLSKEVLSTNERAAGYREAIAKAKMKLVVEEYIGHGVNQSAENATKLLEKHKDVELVLTVNETTTAAALIAIRKLPEAKRPKIIGFDFREEFFEAIRNKLVLGLIVQDPYQIGFTAVELIAQAKKSGKLPVGPKYVDPIFLDANNISDKNISLKLEQFK